MKRVTVSITLSDDTWIQDHQLRGIKSAMVAAAVDKAMHHDLSIAALEAKIGTPRKASS